MTRIELAQKLRRQGLSDAAIGAHLAMSRQRVHTLLGPRQAAPQTRPEPPQCVSAEEFEARLRDWRARRGLTQAQAAATLRCPLKTYLNWEYGKPPALAPLVMHLIEMLEEKMPESQP